MDHKPYRGLLYKVIDLGDKYILFDGRSYAILEISDEFKEHLSLYRQSKYRDKKNISNECKEIESLINSKILSYEDDEYFEAPTFKKLILFVTDNCNLRCRYCFEEDHRTKNNNRSMSASTARKCLDYLFQHSPSDNITVHLFGGEPLNNFGVVKDLVEYGNKLAMINGKKINYLLVTNGTLLTKEIVTFLKTHCISVQISLDGCEKINDANRVYPNGKGSYKDAIRGLNLLRSGNVNYGILSVVSKQAADSAAWVSELNDIAGGNFSLAIAANTNSAIKPNSLLMKSFISEYRKLLNNMTKSCSDLNQNVLPVKKIVLQIKAGKRHYYGCGAGLEELTVSSNGELYLCERLQGELKCNIDTASPPSELWYKYLNDITCSRCSKCWAKYLCGGGCAHTIKTLSKNKLPPWWTCGIKKAEIETAIKLIYNESTIKGGEEYEYFKNSACCRAG